MLMLTGLFRIVIVVAAALFVVATAQAVDGSVIDFPDQVQPCPNALPAKGIPGSDRMKKYGDWRHDPAHTRAQWEAAKQRMAKLSDCSLWIVDSAILGWHGYRAHQRASTPFTKKVSSKAYLKKDVWSPEALPAKEPKNKLGVRMEREAIDLAYENQAPEQIIRTLYCKCQSLYPGMLIQQQKYWQRLNEKKNQS